jgi:hypothetical protein
VACVNFGRDNDLRIAIRGGGHNGAGFGSVDNGLVIDLSAMKGVRVDPKARTVRVGPGCTTGEVDHATHLFGQAVPFGIISTTGVAGITLNGGHGYLGRQYGLVCDNLIEADIVLADGSFLTASKEENADLFWALRGGGGNFGVVTSFLFRMHPVQTDYAGPTLYELSEAADVMKWYRKFLPKAPKELTGFFMFMTVPPGPPFPEHLHMKKMCGIAWCYSGPLKNGEKMFKPIRAFKKPALDLVGPIPHPVWNSMFDALYPPGQNWYWKADFVKDLSDEAIALHIKHGSDLPTWQSTMHLYPIDGVASKVKPNATAWGNRDARWAEVIVGVDSDPKSKEKMTKWARDYWAALHPHNLPGAYVNFMMADEGDDRIKATYRDNYKKLVAVKRKYDKDNLFKVNQNIKP